MILRGASAAILLLVTLYASHAAAMRLVSSRQRAVRWIAAGLLACWSAICVFHLLAAFQQFRILPALIIALGGGISIRWMTGLEAQRVFSLVLDDLIVACRYLQGSGGPGRKLARLALVSLVGTVVARALILPPLGWDSITYHAVKAAMWVQTGGSLPLDLPGRWSDFKYFPPAGEILGAWAMLPFHADLAYGLVDVALWLGCGIVLHALAREVGVADRLLPYSSLYLLTVPAVYFWIGSGYVDVTTHFFALSGLLFILRWAGGRQETVSLSLWILAWSSAVAVKITALPLLLLGGVVILVAMIRQRGADRATLLGLLSGGLAAAMVLLPIFIRNYSHLGFPLSPFPARIAGLTLGRIGPALDWISQPDAWSWGRELVALVRVLGIGAGPNLGPIAVVVLAASLPAAIARLRARPFETSLLIGFAACTAWPYFSKAYAITRVTRYGGNGRFLYCVLVVAALLVAASIASMRSRRAERTVITLTVAAAVGSALTNLTVNASSLEWPALLIGAIALPLLVTCVARCRSGAAAGIRAAALAGGTLLATSLAAPSLQSYRSELRYESLDRSRMGHEILTYWTSMAALMDEPERAHKLALSQAPFHYAGSFLYYFMGSRFQNELHFVSPTRDGGTPELSLPEDDLQRQLDFEAWFRRLHQKGVTHVVVLTPPWHELDWLQANPQEFTFVLGDPSFYGLWRVRSGPLYRPPEEVPPRRCAPEEVP